ncbi:MAG: glycoside hydrolase family 53 protein [Tepidisphaeraceae bacterium]
MSLLQRLCSLPIAFFLAAAALSSSTLTRAAVAQTSPVLSGADVSGLPDIEKAGGIFRDHGKPGDEIKILREHGCSLYRVRLFVDPDPDFKHNYGATQNLAMVTSLGQRIKAAGGMFLLDLHYSDTWADPSHQTKPAAWKDLDFDALVKRVGDYTTEVIHHLQAAGAAPDMVQVGNEITSGILWPDAHLSSGPKADEPTRWRNFVRLLTAGAKAVHAAEQPGKPIRVVLHIHGGGRDGLPTWFFGELKKHGGDAIPFDIIGLSFYPAWNDSIAALKKNADELVKTFGKDILLAEVAYAWKPVTDIEGHDTMQWPTTPDGQRQFLSDVHDLLAHIPAHHGLGYCWWYPDSIQVPGLKIWRNGAEALFDSNGDPLPALSVFARP